MSQNYKYVKPKKKFDFSKILDYVRCLWSNAACLDKGLNKKWYVAVIIALFSVIFSVIPLAVHSATSNGSSFLSSTYIYNFDEGFYSFLEDANTNNYSITFDRENGSAKLEGKTATSSNNYLIYQHKYEANDQHATSYIDFQVFFIPEDVNFSTVASTISALNVNSLSGRDASYIIFGTKVFSTVLYKYGSYSSVGGVSGDYHNLDDTYSSIKDFYVTDQSTRILNTAASLALYKTFINEGYTNNRITYTWLQVGVITAVNTAITLLMGLVLFLMTRGKNNPNRVIKFQQCFNVAYWCALTPGLLALILGFFFSGYEIMLYVVIYGFRIMWLSMKTLTPGPSSK